ncbi:DNA-binding protein [Bacillus methanolicus]|nr:DNA-binding protein [Bacillus methanolicus]
MPLRIGGFPIRKSPDQCLLTAPRSISVLVPSFIGS